MVRRNCRCQTGRSLLSVGPEESLPCCCCLSVFTAPNSGQFTIFGGFFIAKKVTFRVDFSARKVQWLSMSQSPLTRTRYLTVGDWKILEGRREFRLLAKRVKPHWQPPTTPLNPVLRQKTEQSSRRIAVCGPENCMSRARTVSTAKRMTSKVHSAMKDRFGTCDAALVNLLEKFMSNEAEEKVDGALGDR